MEDPAALLAFGASALSGGIGLGVLAWMLGRATGERNDAPRHTRTVIRGYWALAIGLAVAGAALLVAGV